MALEHQTGDSEAITKKLSKNKITSTIMPVMIALSAVLTSCNSNETAPQKKYKEYVAELWHEVKVLEYTDFKIEREKGHNKVYYNSDASPVAYTHVYTKNKARNSVELCLTSDKNPQEAFGITDRNWWMRPWAETQKFQIVYNKSLAGKEISENSIDSREEHDVFDIITLDNGQKIMYVKDTSNVILFGEAKRAVSVWQKTALCVTTSTSQEWIVRIKNYAGTVVTDDADQPLTIQRK